MQKRTKKQALHPSERISERKSVPPKHNLCFYLFLLECTIERKEKRTKVLKRIQYLVKSLNFSVSTIRIPGSEQHPTLYLGDSRVVKE